MMDLSDKRLSICLLLPKTGNHLKIVWSAFPTHKNKQKIELIYNIQNYW